MSQGITPPAAISTPSLSGDQTWTGAQTFTRSIFAGPNPWFDVTHPKYLGGADPSGIVDSSPAIQAAHDAMAARGGTILVPPGIYRCSSQLVFTKSLVLRGAGNGVSSALAASVLSFDAGVAGISLTGASQFSKVLDLYLKSASTSLGTDDGITTKGHATVIDNVVVEGFGRDGVVADTSVSGNANCCGWRNVRSVSNKRYGFLLKGGNSNVIVLDNCSAVSNTSDGYRLENVANCSLLAPHADANGTRDYYDSGNSNAFHDVYAEGGGGFLIDTGSSSGFLSTGAYAPPTITNSGTNWTVLKNGKWRTAVKVEEPGGQEYQFQAGLYSAGYLSLVNQTGSKNIFDVDGGSTRFEFLIPVLMGAGQKFTADSGTATGAALAATLNKQTGTITTESLSTAAGAASTYTITNSVVTASSKVFVGPRNGSNTIQPVYATNITPGAGSFTVDIRNGHASSALNGTLLLAFWVLP